MRIQNRPLGRNRSISTLKRRPFSTSEASDFSSKSRPIFKKVKLLKFFFDWIFRNFFDSNFSRWFYRYQFAPNPAQNGLILDFKLFSFDIDKIIIWYLFYMIIKWLFILFYSNMTLSEINHRFKISFGIFAEWKWTVIGQTGRSRVKMNGP